jgi:hypothetical protein
MGRFLSSRSPLAAAAALVKRVSRAPCYCDQRIRGARRWVGKTRRRLERTKNEKKNAAQRHNPNHILRDNE